MHDHGPERREQSNVRIRIRSKGTSKVPVNFANGAGLFADCEYVALWFTRVI